MKEKIIIGIIDDEPEKSLQVDMILTDNDLGKSSNDYLKYNFYNLEVVAVPLYEKCDEVFNYIVANKFDCLIIDYKIQSNSTVSYNGVKLAKYISDRLYEFPIFILTSYEIELYNNDLFNAYQVFDYTRFMDEKNEQLELKIKIIEQILKYRKQIKVWEERLKILLPKQGTSAKIDAEIIDLDDKLERTVDAKFAIPKLIKSQIMSDKFDVLINELKEIVNEVK